MPQEVLVLSLGALFVAIGFGVMIPVLPMFAKQFGVSTFEIGLVVSGFSAMRLVTSPFCGRINAWLGERLVIGIGMFGVAASSVLAGLSRSFQQLLLWRALGGIGSAMFTVAAISMLLSSVPANKRGQASGMYQGGFLIGGMAGPALGGILGTISLSAPFFFYAGALVVAGLINVTLIRKPRATSASDSARKPRPMKEVVRDVGYQAACASAFGQGWQSIGARATLIPILIGTTLALDSKWTGIAFSIAAVAQALVLAPVGKAVDTIGRRPLMIAAGLITGSAALAMPFASTIWILIGLLCLYSVGAAMQGTAPTAAVGDAARGSGGTPIAVFSMTTDIGAILGPMVAGALADSAWGMPAAFGVGAAILFAAAVYATFMPKRLAGAPDPS